MTLESIPLEDLRDHPENSNRMSPRLLETLKRHIRRTGMYEPLVVRVLPDDEKRPASWAAILSLYQILNGHHRAKVLRELGHTHARCDVWAVKDDDEARLLLATLNRLEGRDDPAARGRLLARLAEAMPKENLVRLLPEPPDAIERLERLSERPPEPAAPESLPPQPRPMTFFLTDEQYATVRDGLSAAAKRAGTEPTARSGGRAIALERLARWYLDSQPLS